MDRRGFDGGVLPSNASYRIATSHPVRSRFDAKIIGIGVWGRGDIEITMPAGMAQKAVGGFETGDRILLALVENRLAGGVA